MMLSFSRSKRITMQANYGMNRRDFIRKSASGAAAIGLTSTSPILAANNGPIKNCIFLFLTGGPSQLDTLDPKPNAPEQVRGPFASIPTAIPGVRFSELLPGLASRAGQLTLIRSLHHDQAPIHETGQQLIQTGLLAGEKVEPPHLGAVIAAKSGARVAGIPPFVILPSALGSTGVNMYQGQGSGALGNDYQPVRMTLDEGGWKGSLAKTLNRMTVDGKYGVGKFGQSCQAALNLVEAGTRFVCVNMFETVFNSLSWDCHADGGSLATSLVDYRTRICPMLDKGMSALLDDLKERGLFDSTLVVAVGEFGRSPWINARGGRDHHSGVWSGLLAGAGLPGGAVIGSSDDIGNEPAERPVHAASFHATIARALGVSPTGFMPAISELF